MWYTVYMNVFALWKNRIRRFFYERKRKALELSFPLYCKIHGVKNADSQGALAQTRAGDRLQYVHVPVENYPYNVYVYSVALNRVLGYLDKALSKRLVKLFKKGFCRDAVVENRTGGGTHTYFGCNIRLLETADMMEGSDFSALRGA